MVITQVTEYGATITSTALGVEGNKSISLMMPSYYFEEMHAFLTSPNLLGSASMTIVVLSLTTAPEHVSIVITTFCSP